MTRGDGASREPVVRAGLKLLNERGLEGLTLAAIGKELNVRAPTLYWRFNSKKDLIDEMATCVVEDWAEALPRPAPKEPWQSYARTFAQTLRGALKTYREGARLVAGTYLRRPVLHRPMEASLAVFVEGGMELDTAALCLSSLYVFVMGFTIEEQAVVIAPGERDARYDAVKQARRFDAAAFPLTGEVASYFLGNYDRRFEQGLDTIIAGIAYTASR